MICHANKNFVNFELCVHAACSLVVCLYGLGYNDKLKLGTFIIFRYFLAESVSAEVVHLCWFVPRCVCVYVCVGKRDACLHAGFCASVPQPPTITHQSPKDYIIDPRENIIIHCEAKGKPHPRWVSL